MRGVERNLELGHGGRLRLKADLAGDSADPPRHVDVLLRDPYTALMSTQRDVDHAVGQFQVGVVAILLGGLRHGGEEPRRHVVVPDRVARVKGLSQLAPVAEAGIDDLLIA